MRYFVMVKPGASREEVAAGGSIDSVGGGAMGDVDGVLTVYLRAKPHDGEANAALVRVLAEHFKVGKTRVKIVAGAKGKRKVVEIL